jgi:hypothetical protein
MWFGIMQNKQMMIVIEEKCILVLFTSGKRAISPDWCRTSVPVAQPEP